MAGRRVSPYPTRIILDYQAFYGSADHAGPFFVCLSEGDIELIRVLLGYARREINWAVDMSGLPAYYMTPDDAQLENIEDKIEQMEGRLMAVICVQDIVEAIDTLESTLQGGLECICNAMQAVQANTVQNAGEELLTGVSEELLTFEDNVPDFTPPTENADACNAAQCAWWFVYEYVTEIAGPLADLALGTIVTLALGKLAVIMAGVAEIFRINPAQLIALITDIAQGLVGSTEAQIVNFLLASKDEIVCRLYWGFVNENLDGAIEEVGDIIDASDLSSAAKTGLKRGFSKPFVYLAAAFRDGSWGSQRVEEGYCDDCPIIEGCLDFCDPVWGSFSPSNPVGCDVISDGLASGQVICGRGLTPGVYNLWVYGHCDQVNPFGAITIGELGLDTALVMFDEVNVDQVWQGQVTITNGSLTLYAITGHNAHIHCVKAELVS